MTTVMQRVRREKAAQRLLSHAERSVEDQLVLIAQRPGESRREVKRLTGEDITAADALEMLREG